MWGILLAIAVPVAGGCGSKQSASSTVPKEPAVSGAGAEVPKTSTSSPTPEASPELPTDAVEEVTQIDRTDEEREPDQSAEARRSARRDVRMVSYEDAMARPVEVGDATIFGGEAQLSADEVASFMDDHLARSSCAETSSVRSRSTSPSVEATGSSWARPSIPGVVDSRNASEACSKTLDFPGSRPREWERATGSTRAENVLPRTGPAW